MARKKRDPEERPEGEKYRNLCKRGSTVYYERLHAGRRLRVSTKAIDWDEAAAFRDLYEERKGIARGFFPSAQVPTFATFAKRYLKEDVAHLAPTTRQDRQRLLGELPLRGHPDAPPRRGALLTYFGAQRIDEIAPATLRTWWGERIEGAGLTTKSGRNYVDALSGVFAYALDLGLIESNPAAIFRQTLRRRTRTQRGRAAAAPGRNIRPVEDPRHLAALASAAREEGLAVYVFTLLGLDAGLRLGESLGLRWQHVVWGTDEADPRRALRIEESRPRGGAVGLPKSGRSRTVALSRRLRAALEELRRERWNPDPAAHVLEGLDPGNFRHRDWRRVCQRAGVGHVRAKDLRDSYASHLLTAGVQLGWISRQLGHSNVATTATHYATWAGGDSYRSPLVLTEGELPPDLLARLAGSPQSPPTLRKRGNRAAGRRRKEPSEISDFRGF